MFYRHGRLLAATGFNSSTTLGSPKLLNGLLEDAQATQKTFDSISITHASMETNLQELLASVSGNPSLRNQVHDAINFFKLYTHRMVSFQRSIDQLIEEFKAIQSDYSVDTSMNKSCLDSDAQVRNKPPPPRPNIPIEQQRLQQGTTSTTAIDTSPSNDPPNVLRKVLDPMRLVGDIKKEIAAEKGIPPDWISLWNGGQLLNESKRLCDYPVADARTLEVRPNGSFNRPR